MKVTISPAAAQQFTELPRSVQVRMVGLIERLEHWPSVSGAKALRGELAGQFRLRTGDYRMQFQLAGNELIVNKVGHRDGFYDE